MAKMNRINIVTIANSIDGNWSPFFLDRKFTHFYSKFHGIRAGILFLYTFFLCVLVNIRWMTCVIEPIASLFQPVAGQHILL